MSGIIATASFGPATIKKNKLQDIFEFTIPSESVVVLHEVRIWQTSHTLEQSWEQFSIGIRRVVGGASGTGGSGSVERAHKSGGGSIFHNILNTEVLNANAMSGGTNTLIIPVIGNSLQGVHYRPHEDSRIVFSPSEILLVKLEEQLSKNHACGGYITYEVLTIRTQI